jgi:hypothetical protein
MFSFPGYRLPICVFMALAPPPASTTPAIFGEFLASITFLCFKFEERSEDTLEVWRSVVFTTAAGADFLGAMSANAHIEKSRWCDAADTEEFAIKKIASSSTRTLKSLKTAN